MSHIHAFQIDKLKTDFDNIITLKKEIAKVKQTVAEKLSQLKLQYNELIKTNSKKIFLFCLDSFYFQYKTFAMEMEHIDRTRALMNNRMYCDYYKLHNIIVSHIKENKADIDISDLDTKSYPPYKDLEPFQEYKLEDIKEIHTAILLIINRLYNQAIGKYETIENYNDNHKIGFSISNFLNTLQYENRLLKEQISLYMNYVSFFHISQKKQLNRIFLRMNDFYREVDENININRTFSIDDIGDEDKLHKFFIIGEEVVIENILEDSELLMENSDKMIDRLETMIEKKEADENITAELVEVSEVLQGEDKTGDAPDDSNKPEE
jgi:hypothetical protein